MSRITGPLILFLLCSVVASAFPGPAPIPQAVIRSSAPHKQIRILNEAEPGRQVDIRENLVPGRTNIVVFFADW